MLKCIVLLAEDFEDAREVYSLYLKLEGFTVHDVPDGSRVMPLAIELQPDVVVLDMGLPGLDGLAVADLLRCHALTAHMPIVVLSAHAYPEDEARALAAGAAAFLRKPCSPVELAMTLRRVSETCDAKQGRRPVAAPAAP